MPEINFTSRLNSFSIENEKLGIVMRDDEMWRKYFLYCINLFRYLQGYPRKDETSETTVRNLSVSLYS